MLPSLSQLPLDIQLVFLTDWLRGRRLVKPDWFLVVREVRQKMADALKDMPETEEIKELLSRTQITYFQSVEIVSMLKTTEQDTKNILGFYSSQRMKDWNEVVQMYLKNNVYLADAALVLNNLVKLELPAIRKDLLGQERKLMEQAKKIEKNERLAEQQDKLFQEEIARRGIEGNNLRIEIVASTNSLTAIVDQMDKLILKLSPAVDYYQKTKEMRTPGKSTLPMLNFYFANGRGVTAFEWIYGHPPSEEKGAHTADSTVAFLTKAFDRMDLNGKGEEAIDFGLNEETDGIQLLDDVDESERKPTAEEMLNLLENRKTLKELMEEIKELCCFLGAVEANEERKHPADLLLTRYIEDDVKLSDIWKWNAIAAQIWGIVNDPVNVERLEIRFNPHFLDEVVNKIERFHTMSKFYRDCAKAVEKEMVALKEVCNVIASSYWDVKKETEKLEERLCKELAQFTKGRPVHLIGGVKSLPSL